MKKLLSLRFISVLMLVLCGISVASSQTTVSQTSFSVLSADNIDGDTNLSYSTAKNDAGTSPAINNNQIRLYQGNPGGSITITAKNGAKITSVGVTTAMATTVATKVDNGSESEHKSLAANATHTVSNINATNVEFICYGSDKNSRLYVSGITVTYVASNKTTAEVTFVDAEEIYNVTLGDTFIAPIATTNSDATITYTSSNEDCATVANDGSVTLLSKGKTVITAAVEATEEYTSASASYTINVTRTLPANTIFYESFDGCNKEGGNDGKWASINTTGDISADNTGWTFVSGNQASECARFGTGSAKGSAKTPKLNLIEGSVNCTLTFKAAAWNGNSEKTGLDITIEGGGTLGTSSVTLAKGVWTEYTIDITGATKDTQITFAAQEDKNNRFFLDEVLITEVTAPTSATITIGETGYATYYNSEKAFIMPEDCVGYIAANEMFCDMTEEYVIDGIESIFVPVYYGGNPVPAGEAVIISSENPGKKELNFFEPVEGSLFICWSLAGCNDLHGTDAAETTKAYTFDFDWDTNTGEWVEQNSDDYYFYGLSYNTGDPESVGFYWMNEGGAPFTNGAHKVYLTLPKSAGAKKQILFNDKGTTAINNVVNTAKTLKNEVYNLAGQKVDSNYKGIVIINGKKHLNK